ncbi:MAG: response regulator [Chloroflexota bacterium]
MNEPLALIVEDDEDINEIFRQALAAAGFATEVARDGQTAMDFLDKTVPYIVILDLHLPNVSGETILKKIRSNPNLEKIRVVITTADAVAAEFLRSQADFVMVKPISYIQLRDLTKRLNPQEKPRRFKIVQPGEEG